jgi:hypothetical protein
MWYRPSVRRIPIGLTDSQHARLGREAARRHVSVGALVREAVDATFPDELVLGAFDSGRSDISERHDDLLGESPW